MDLIERTLAEKRVEDALSKAFVGVAGMGKNILKSVPSVTQEQLCKNCKLKEDKEDVGKFLK